jgi:hypothetical protein
MTKNINTLAAIARKFKNLTAEKIALAGREKQARQDLVQAASAGPLEDSRIARKISDSNATLDAVHARRAFIDRELCPSLGQMKDALRAADNQWTRIVRAEGDRIAANFYAVNAQF